MNFKFALQLRDAAPLPTLDGDPQTCLIMGDNLGCMMCIQTTAKYKTTAKYNALCAVACFNFQLPAPFRIANIKVSHATSQSGSTSHHQWRTTNKCNCAANTV